MATTKPLCLSILSAALLLGVAQEARAAYTVHFVPGTVCVKAGSGGSLDYWARGAVRNASSTAGDWLDVYCPIPSSEGDDGETVGVQVNGSGTQQGVSCSVYAADLFATAWNWSGWKSNTAGSGTYQLSYDISDRWSYNVHCTLNRVGAQSNWIGNINVVEPV